ncbi:MAG: hypothetical protein PHE68_04820, partial [Candidatus Peribacteraceae bacterium]|nr:hypothetical protein [Candidatus Peribacteraceae bacterium]
TTRIYREMGLSTTRARYQFSEYQINAIKECIIEYGMYYLKNGSLLQNPQGLYRELYTLQAGGFIGE